MGMGSTTTMTIKRLRRVKRSGSGRAPVRDAGLRPAPYHEAELAAARGLFIPRSRAQRRVSNDEAPGASDLNAPALYRLMAWLSPSYPIGAFSYSSGIEWAVAAGDIADAAALRRWLESSDRRGRRILQCGVLRSRVSRGGLQRWHGAAMTANLISTRIRLVPLGQTDGQRVLAALEPVATATAARALTTPLDQVGGAAFRADLASMRHETQYTRLFRS
jgi:hypothetical protein